MGNRKFVVELLRVNFDRSIISLKKFFLFDTFLYTSLKFPQPKYFINLLSLILILFTKNSKFISCDHLNCFRLGLSDFFYIEFDEFRFILSLSKHNQNNKTSSNSRTEYGTTHSYIFFISIRMK